MSRPGPIAQSRAHLASVGEDYFEHMRFAATVGSLMVAAGLACLLHAVLPAVFPDKASRTIRHLHRVIEQRERVESLGNRAEGGLLTLGLLSLVCALLPWIVGANLEVAAPLSLLSLGFPAAAFASA